MGLTMGIYVFRCKCVGVTFNLRKIPNSPLTLDYQPIPLPNSVMFLGIDFYNRFTWKKHIDHLLVRVQKKRSMSLGICLVCHGEQTELLY